MKEASIITIILGVLLFFPAMSPASSYSNAVEALNPQIYYRMSDPTLEYADAVDNEVTDDGTLDGLMGFPGGYPESAPHSGVAGPRPSDKIGGQNLEGLDFGNYGMEFTGVEGGVNNSADLIYIGDFASGHVLDSELATYSFFFKSEDIQEFKRVTSTDSAFDHRFEIMMTLGKIVVVNTVGDADYIQTVDAYNDGQWHHLVAVRNSDTAGDMKLFIDGEQPAVDTIFDGWSTNSRCRIGAQGTNTNAWIGVMDEYAHFTTALTDVQVLSLFEAAKRDPVITVSKIVCDLNEAGPTSDTYEIVCLQIPDPNITVVITPSADTGNASDIKLSSGTQNGDWGDAITLFFDTSDWNVPQTVTVTAADDNDWNSYGDFNRANPHKVIIDQVGISSNPDFDGDVVADVTVNIIDDDVPYIKVTESLGYTYVEEAGPTDSYTIVPGIEPNSNLTIEIELGNSEIALSSGAQNPGVGQAITLTFTVANWDTAQTLTVTADNDGDVEGDDYSIVTHHILMGTSQYTLGDGAPIDDVTVFIGDDDNPAYALTDDLVLNLKLDGNLLDYSGRCNNGTAGGDPNFVAGKVGSNALYFDSGSKEYVSCGSSDDFNFGTDVDFSISVWINKPFNQTDYNNTAIISNKDWSSGSNPGYVGGIADNGRIEWNIGDGSNHEDYDGPAGQVSIGQWHHIVASHDRNGVAGLYLDGIPVIYTSITSIENINAGLPTVIGADGTLGEYETYFNGNIDNVLVWRRAMDITEVQELFNGGNGIEVENGSGYMIIETEDSTSVDEDGPTSDNYTIALNTEPSVTVTVLIEPDVNSDQIDVGAGIGAAVTLTFTTSNWDIAQTVTVTAVDNDSYEGDLTATIKNTVTSTGDVNYDGFIVSLDVEVLDDDVPTVTITESENSTEMLEGESDSYSVVLDMDPKADVIITVDPNSTPDYNGKDINLGSGVGVAITLTFTTSDWSTPQTVTVTAEDDDVITGDRGATITHSAASVGDYDGISIDGVSVGILEDECGYWGYLPMDSNEDCYVNLVDLAELVSQWLNCTQPFQEGCVDLAR